MTSETKPLKLKGDQNYIYAAGYLPPDLAEVVFAARTKELAEKAKETTNGPTH